MLLSSKARLGAYEILGPLGASGMGEVYSARDTRLGRDVAIKVLPADVVLERQGRSEEALAEDLQEPDEALRLYALAIVHHAAGRRKDSDGALQRLTENVAAGSAFQIACVHAAR